MPPRSEPNLERSQNEHEAKKPFSICAWRPRRAAPGWGGQTLSHSRPCGRKPLVLPVSSCFSFAAAFEIIYHTQYKGRIVSVLPFFLRAWLFSKPRAVGSIERDFPTSFEKDVAAFLHRAACPLAVLSTERETNKPRGSTCQ